VCYGPRRTAKEAAGRTAKSAHGNAAALGNAHTHGKWGMAHGNAPRTATAKAHGNDATAHGNDIKARQRPLPCELGFAPCALCRASTQGKAFAVRFGPFAVRG
jgi:hypothetical protein